MNMRKAIIFALIVVLSGCCAGRPNSTELANADPGLFPTNYLELVTGHITRTDPFGLAAKTVVVTKPEWYAACSCGSMSYGWAGNVNMKEAEKDYTYMIRDGAVIDFKAGKYPNVR